MYGGRTALARDLDIIESNDTAAKPLLYRVTPPDCPDAAPEIPLARPADGESIKYPEGRMQLQNAWVSLATG